MDGNQTLHASHSDLRRRLESPGASRLARIVGETTDAITRIADKHRVTPQELRAVVGFAVDIGLATDDRRNEWVLLLDTMGLTGTVETANLDRPAGVTPQTLGPFYRCDAPIKSGGDTLSIDNVGTELVFTARVVDLDAQPVRDATVDVWQANSDGVYENQDPDSQPEFNLRGRFRTDPFGEVTFRTKRPAGYTLPDDGPVAYLMRLLGLSMTRPAHIQFRIEAQGFQTLVTQVFDQTDPNLGTDPLFCVSPDLLADFGDPSAGGGCRTSFTFKLARARRGASAN